ncbi:GntR family transcriptional regulator [Acrocarpospora corrugata]|uniref:GntR family transcriptional regulator n=1 Tax=Acrocarpospora corrugata TaxID=35763 RepID=A0A5M3VSB1_9ACTN|nr:GntR family transcriptional regulator [Acrocarpospora corrugata]GER99666.1 GntR family transcriptional regulator [Acrocarpospora corrugata]
MRVLKQTNLREQAKEVIRASIVGGELVSGQVYSATTLSGRLGVSPTPVREALLDLANEGLVEPIRNRGYRILTMADKDLDEISELRKMLEIPAMRLVVQKAGDADLAVLESSVVAIDEAAADKDLVAFLNADRTFHLALLGLTGNSRLVRLVGQLRDQTRLVGLKRMADVGSLAESAAEHRPILEALRARDADRAESLVRHHLDQTRGIWAGRRET